MFKTILTATDQVTVRDVTVMAALNLSAHYQSDLHILHVLESSSPTQRRRIRHYRNGTEHTADASYRNEVQAHLRETYPEGRRSLPAVAIDVATGLPWQAIFDRARHIEADLIVLGPHSGRADTRGVVRVTGSIGSTLEGVIMHAGCPVMIVNRTVPPEGAVFKRVLVGVDFSAACECALCFAAKVAPSDSAQIHVFHMLPVPPFPKYSRRDYENDKRMTRRRIEEFGGRYLDGKAHTYHVWGGIFPYSELLQCARKVDADLIVLGSHTKEQNGKWYAGSVVERVGLRASCPVIVISAPKVLQAWKDVRAVLKKREGLPVDRRVYVFDSRSVP